MIMGQWLHSPSSSLSVYHTRINFAGVKPRTRIIMICHMPMNSRTLTHWCTHWCTRVVLNFVPDVSTACPTHTKFPHLHTQATTQTTRCDMTTVRNNSGQGHTRWSVHSGIGHTERGTSRGVRAPKPSGLDSRSKPDPAPFTSTSTGSIPAFRPRLTTQPRRRAILPNPETRW